MPRTKKIKDNPDLIKDTASQAVINTNTTAIQARRRQIALTKAKDAEILQMRNDIAELKSLIKQLGKK
jgi:hypothetical protein